MTRLMAALGEHLNFIAFAMGFAVFYVGVHALSAPVANIAAGGLVMAAAAWPYLHLSKGTR